MNPAGPAQSTTAAVASPTSARLLSLDAYRGFIMVCLVTLATGLLTSCGVTSHPPLEVLRQET